MEKVTYCRFCNEKHIVSETRDPAGNVVGMFCNRKKALITAYTSVWNGDDVLPRLEKFTEVNVDRAVLPRMQPDKLEGLSRKFAYYALQSDFARERKLNYAFVQHHILDILRALRQRRFYEKVGV
ncbi:hypothetical protein [Paenibacillus terrigena]|uniref:hypothetical protein n=1 Tax=Paenibacillus terrigena TaxID=369333 RepID=UPI0028D88CFD|nr:hypothetical protein [Paenibacillus terrigena]